MTLPTVVIGDTQPAPTASKAPGSIPDSVSETSPGPAPGPGTSPGVSQAPAPVPGTSPGPALIPGANPGPALIPGASPDPTPIPGSSPSPVPAFGASPDLAPIPGASSGPAPIPDANPGPAPIPGTSPSPARIPGAGPDPTPVPDANPSPAPVPGTSPDPTPIPGTSPGPAPSPSSPLSTIWADDAAAMRSIIDHLHALGHRRIVHIAGLPGLAHTDRRVAALRAEAARLGMDAADVRSVCTDYSDEQGAEATRRLLAAPHPPTAIVYDNDVMAVAGAAVAAGLGVPVPGALSIVAWDDSPLCRVTHPRLTSLVRDTAGFGRLAAQELLSLLDGAPTRRLQAELPHLELRESTTRAP
ncbi:substrate-binding domain-containing protein [Streptomyces chrestomyceticus]|uniref:substrate-binding domain-containing protein n=1 Tax=Streptomyces chrestomyceticus TaxID=68185 RepID=UPI0035307E9A